MVDVSDDGDVAQVFAGGHLGRRIGSPQVGAAQAERPEVSAASRLVSAFFVNHPRLLGSLPTLAETAIEVEHTKVCLPHSNVPPRVPVGFDAKIPWTKLEIFMQSRPRA